MPYVYDYPMCSYSVDIVVLSDSVDYEYDPKVKVLLIKRGGEPYKDFWALPGGYVEYNETAAQAAVRELKEETNLDIHLTKHSTYDDPKRDPRGRTISQLFHGVNYSQQTAIAGDDAKEVGWFDEKQIKKMSLAFDHKEMIWEVFNWYRVL